jgi:RNA polymerase sigma factor (sigma-70 family)
MLSMDDVIKLVKNYRITSSAIDSVRLAEQICGTVAPKLSFYIYSAVRPPEAEDLLQETLKGVFTGLRKFAGNSNGEFWQWCHTIARNKMNDHFGKKRREKLDSMSPEEMIAVVDVAASDRALSVADKIDLQDAMKALAAANPECHNYLWQHFIFGRKYDEIAVEEGLTNDAVRMRINRCLDVANSMVK